MGMRDESWCSSCGTSLPYSEDEVQCGECVTERADMIDSSFIEYMKIHLISLEQDSDEIGKQLDEMEEESENSDSIDAVKTTVSTDASETETNEELSSETE